MAVSIHFEHMKRVNMKKSLCILFALLLLLSLFVAQNLDSVQGETKDTLYTIRSSTTYINPTGGSRIWNFSQEDRSIGLFMNTSWQNVELKNATYTLESIHSDEDGNKIGVLKLPISQLLSGENLSVTIEYSIVTKPRMIANISESESDLLDEIPNNLIQSYTSAGGPWLTSNQALVDLAQEIAGNETNVLKIVARTIDWIKHNIIYAMGQELPMYANQTLNLGVGDCDDQAILLTTLLRIIGIPSYVQIGAIYMPQTAELSERIWEDHVQFVEKKIGWHGWAMVYVPPWGWLPVDLTYVFEGFEDPLNAISYGAVTRQNTVQYMNISKVDYVADSHEARSSLIENGFLLYYEEEMIAESLNEGSGGFNPIATAIFIVVIVVIILPVGIVIFRRRRKQSEIAKPASTESPGNKA